MTPIVELIPLVHRLLKSAIFLRRTSVLLPFVFILAGGELVLVERSPKDALPSSTEAVVVNFQTSCENSAVTPSLPNQLIPRRQTLLMSISKVQRDFEGAVIGTSGTSSTEWTFDNLGVLLRRRERKVFICRQIRRHVQL